MDFSLSEEQRALQQMARDFLKERWSPDRARRALDAQPATIDEPVWDEIVSMGWLGVAAPEEAGGIGGDVLTAAVLVEEAGRGLLPGPFGSALAAVIAVEASGDEALITELLPKLVAGELRATLAIEEPGGGWGPANVRMKAATGADGFALSGTKILVPDARGADLLLVAASTDHGPALFRVPADVGGVTINPMFRMDAQAIAEVVFEAVQVPVDAPVGGAAGGECALRSAYEVATLLCAADLLGTTQAALDMTVAYAKHRVQYGKPIGAYQAVSHRLADSLVDVELGRSLLYGACLAVDEQRENASALISAAKAWLSDVAVEAGEAALQLHGGVGFTWEYDVHLHLRRAHCNAATYGDAPHHHAAIATYLEQTLAPAER